MGFIAAFERMQLLVTEPETVVDLTYSPSTDEFTILPELVRKPLTCSLLQFLTAHLVTISTIGLVLSLIGWLYRKFRLNQRQHEQARKLSEEVRGLLASSSQP